VVGVFESPTAGFIFTDWSGACSGTGVCFVTMNAPATVTASFNRPTYAVSVNVPAGVQYSIGGFQFTGSSSTPLPAGSYELTLASPQTTATGTQSDFVSWSDGGAESHNLTVVAAPLTVTGAFKTQYLLTTIALPPTEGSVSSVGYYDAGSPVAPAAGAGAGFEFHYWSSGCSGSSPICFVVMNAPTTVTANFSLPFNWVPLFPATSPNNPNANIKGILVYDEARQQTVLFNSEGDCAASTWVWDGANWTQKFPAHSPSSRADFAMAYDAARQRTVLFGSRANRRSVNSEGRTLKRLPLVGLEPGR
jgi:hypothetical protein